jgi:flagellar FliJ protein
MATSSALDTLIELATKASDEAARRLGRAVQSTQQAEEKLALLLQYRDDYVARFHSNLKTGLSASGYRNFQLFLDKLDEAIQGQQRVVQDAQKRASTARSAWQDSERKRMSYDTLATRAQKAREHKEARLDQKRTDEFAARRLLYKR